MITQLFPGLELKSREFAALFGIFPFKKRLEEFMQHNDPSSLLREILVRIYEEQGGFEKVPDLLFVYNMMYNSNSLNVRNECIHGRGYLSGGSLQFALTVTLCSRYMIAFKINTIKEKVSDILDVSEEAQQPIYPPPACSVHRLFQRPLSASISSLTENTNDWGLRWGQALMM